MPTRLSTHILGFFACLIGCFLAGCDNSSSSNPAGSGSTTKPAASGPVAVKLALNWVPEPQFGGWYQAKEAGIFAKNDLDVSIYSAGANATTIQTVAAGSFEFGITSSEEILIQRENGIDVVALFAIYQKSPRAIMTHKERGLTEIQQVFESGTLIVEPGSTYLKFLEKKYGLGKVNMVPYTPGLPYLNGPDFAQQCFFTSEPVSARNQGKDPQVFLVSESGFNPYMSVLVCRRDYLEKNREVVERFVRSTREGWEAYVADPTKANQVMEKLNTTMSAQTFKDVAKVEHQLIVTDETKDKGLGVMTDEAWTTLAKQLLELGVIKSVPDVRTLFVNIK